MKKNNEILKKQYWSYVFTYAFSYLSGIICGIIDGWFTSHFLDSASIAAYGLCSPFFPVLIIFVTIFSFGMQFECTKRLSNGDTEGSNQVFSAVVILTLIFSFIITTFGLLGTPLICQLLGAGPANTALSQGIIAYSKGFFPGVPFLLLCPILPIAVNICGGKKYVAIATFVQTVVDCVLDWVAIRCNAGLTGLALATTISMVCCFAILMFFMCFKQKMFHFRFIWPSISIIKNIANGGLPSFIRKVMEVLAVVLINIYVLAFGNEYVAARFVVLTLAGFLLPFVTGISSTLQLMAQIFFQEENVKRLRWVSSYTLKVAIISGLFITILLNIFAPQLVGLYVSDPTISSYTLIGLRIYSIIFAFVSITESLFLYMQAAGKFKISNFYAALGKLLLICTAFIMSKILGITGIWLSYTIAEILTILIYLLQSFIRSVTTHSSFKNSVFLISPEFENAKKNSKEWTVSSIDDAIGISLQVEEYLLARGVDKKKTFFAALGIEEMSVIFAEKAKADNKPHQCMIFLLYKPEEILIRFRDDCQIFNIRQQYETLQDNDDPASHAGIRLLFSIVKQLDYSSILNLNTVVLRI